jgi:hypothetical protein
MVVHKNLRFCTCLTEIFGPTRILFQDVHPRLKTDKAGRLWYLPVRHRVFSPVHRVKRIHFQLSAHASIHVTALLTMRATGSGRHRLKPLRFILSWWKRRRFQYLVEVGTPEDTDKEQVEMEQKTGDSVLEVANLILDPPNTPLSLFFSDQSMSRGSSYPFQHAPTVGSFQASLESMDSVMDSHWDPNDETSQATERVANFHGDKFLLEHLNFLSVSTQPQEVELVYDN